MQLLQIQGSYRKNVIPSLNKKIKSSLEPLAEPEFDIILENSGNKKITVTKQLRQIYDIGLRDAWFIIDRTPSVIKEAVSRQEAEYVATRLAEYGAIVKIAKTLNRP